MSEKTGKGDQMPDYPGCGLEMAGYPVQVARARILGFTHAPGVVCLKKLVDPEHRDSRDARSDAEYQRLRAEKCPYHFGFDHSRLWRTKDGELFATADVYDQFDLADLDRLRVVERELGVRVRLSGMTMYAPGYTLMILVTAPGSRVDIELGDERSTDAR